MGPRQLTHEICNHSEGEIVNERGYSTNAIEIKWGIVKRWVKKKCGGALPKLSREDSSCLFQEFFYRQCMGVPSAVDYGHTYELDFKSFLKHVARP